MAGYRLRERAKIDLGAIWRYTDKHWGETQADRYYHELLTCFEELVKNPLIGKERNDVIPGTRSFPQGQHVVFYITEPFGVEIIGIPHQSEDVEKHFELRW